MVKHRKVIVKVLNSKLRDYPPSINLEQDRNMGNYLRIWINFPKEDWL